MEPIKDFEGLAAHLKTLDRPRKVAVVCATDDHSVEAISRALSDGFAHFILVGPHSVPGGVMDGYKGAIESVGFDLTPDEAAAKAVEIVHDGQADVLMKGLINTDNLLRAVLNKEHGLLPKGKVLTHIALVEMPAQDKLLFFSDAAVIPSPNLEQRETIVRYMADAIRRLGGQSPRIALINCTEKVNDKFPVTIDYMTIRDMARNGEFGADTIVDGPMDVRTACDREAAAIKGIDSPVNGNADGLIFPEIQSGNTFYKTITYFAGARLAGLLMGTMAPVVLTSRGDAATAKFDSLALACLLCGDSDTTSANLE